MQPIEHMKGSEDELIAHIKESLTGHEEEYVPGSWENFNQIEGKRNAKVLWLWRLSSAAAVILIAECSNYTFHQQNNRCIACTKRTT
ncbi:hypothetical protein [Pedobacter panaciterrae]